MSSFFRRLVSKSSLNNDQSDEEVSQNGRRSSKIRSTKPSKEDANNAKLTSSTSSSNTPVTQANNTPASTFHPSSVGSRIPQSLNLSAKPAANVGQRFVQPTQHVVQSSTQSNNMQSGAKPPPVPKEYAASFKSAHPSANHNNHGISSDMPDSPSYHSTNQSARHSRNHSKDHSVNSIPPSRSYSNHLINQSVSLSNLPPMMMNQEGYFFPSTLPSMNCELYSDQLINSDDWSLEDRLVHYVHMSSKIAPATCLQSASVPLSHTSTHSHSFAHSPNAVVPPIEAWILDQIRPLCRKGVDINARSTVFPTVCALTSAVCQQYHSVVRYLVSQGADVNQCTNEGFSCLMISMMMENTLIFNPATTHSNNLIFNQILARKPSLEAVDSLHQNALHIAVYQSIAHSNTLALQRMLAARTASALNQQDYNGRTPLMIAVIKESLPIVQFLVGAGSDASIKDKNGLTAFDLHVTQNQSPDQTISQLTEDTLLIRRILSPIPQLTLPYLSAAGYCTYWCNGRDPTVQPNFYRCLTCDRSGLQGICDACHQNCHIGHKMVKADPQLRYYCGCGAGELKGVTTQSIRHSGNSAVNMSCASRPSQQYHTPDGQELDWPMGQLSDAAVRDVLMGLVAALGLSQPVIKSSAKPASAPKNDRRHHRQQSNQSIEARETIIFHPVMQLVEHDSLPVEWTESWAIAFPQITIKLEWRFQGAVAQVSPHQYSIVSSYLEDCNSQLAELSRTNEWPCGCLELLPDLGIVQFAITHIADAECISELSESVEYNHQLARKMFVGLMPPLIRLMMTGNEAALGLGMGKRSFTQTFSQTTHTTPHVQHSTSRSPISPSPDHLSQSPSIMSANDSFSPAPHMHEPIHHISSGAVSVQMSVRPDDDVDLSTESLERLGFEVIPFSNLDLPLDPSLVRTGGGAVVIRGKTLSDETPIALKMFHHQEELEYDARLRKEFFEEAAMLRRSQHSRIVQFLGICVRPFGLVTELLDTSLYDLLYVDRVFLTDMQRATIALEVCRAIAYLHGRQPPIIHRDVKSHNILLNKNLTTIKICDLGIARSKEALKVAVETGNVDGLGTIAWSAPEAFDLAQTFNYEHAEKMDVYSIGCMMYEMLLCRIPWASLEHPNSSRAPGDIIMLVQAGDKPPGLDLDTLSKFTAMPSIWLKLIEACLHHDPAQRPPVVDLVRTFTQIIAVCENAVVNQTSSLSQIRQHNHQAGIDIASPTPTSSHNQSTSNVTVSPDSAGPSVSFADPSPSDAISPQFHSAAESPEASRPQSDHHHHLRVKVDESKTPIINSVTPPRIQPAEDGAGSRRSSEEPEHVHLHFSPPSSPDSRFSVTSSQNLSTPGTTPLTDPSHLRSHSSAVSAEQKHD